MMTVALSDLYLQWVFTAKALEDEVVEDFPKERRLGGRERSFGTVRGLQVTLYFRTHKEGTQGKAVVPSGGGC